MRVCRQIWTKICKLMHTNNYYNPWYEYDFKIRTPSRSSRASWMPVEAPDGTAARNVPVHIHILIVYWFLRHNACIYIMHYTNEFIGCIIRMNLFMYWFYFWYAFIYWMFDMCVPNSVVSSTSTVGLPRLSYIWRAWIFWMWEAWKYISIKL